MDSDFILGMIASEGSFSIHCVPSDKYRHGIKVADQFGLVMYEHDLVKAIRDEVGVGTFTSVSGSNGRTRWDWRVKKNSELRELIEWLDENMTEDFKLSNKYDSYERWKPLVLNKREMLKTKSGVEDLVVKSRKINSDTAKRNPKYSTDELLAVLRE